MVDYIGACPICHGNRAAYPQVPSGHPCSVCGTPYEKHGSYPTCATHPYTPSGRQAEPTEEQIASAWREAQGKVDHETIRRMYRVLAGQQSERPAPAGQAKPVAWMDEWGNPFPLAAKQYSIVGKNWKPLYAAPQAPAGQAVGALRYALSLMFTYFRADENELNRNVFDAARDALAASQAERPAVKEDIDK
jgi:hypothetical protein